MYQNKLNPQSSISDDPYIRGYKYLQTLRQLALEPSMVEVTNNLSDYEHLCIWIGNHIDIINANLNDCLEACHSCFHSAVRRPIQIMAAPLAQEFGIDGLCNILLEPVVILIDVGRTAPQDWLSIVVHEYAHAHIGSPGHDQQFFNTIGHLCLGLGLASPIWQPDLETYLRNWPHCRSTKNHLDFWLGNIW